jgi:PPOX class probable F420-dependent enzyme
VRWSTALADLAALREFWTQRRVCVLGTVRPDGRPHAVAVGATLDFATGIARVIASDGSVKVANVRAAGDPGAPVTNSLVDGGRWCSVAGLARVSAAPEAVAEAERRYAQRYRQPRPNPRRVVIEVTVQSVAGRW